MIVVLKHRFTRMSAGTIEALLLGLTVLSLLPITDSSQESRGVFVGLELPCVFGQVEDMGAQACVLPRLNDTESIRRAAMDDLVEARLRRVVILMKDGDIEGGLNLLAPLLKQGHPRAKFLASELYRRGGWSSAEPTSVDRTFKSCGITA